MDFTSRPSAVSSANRTCFPSALWMPAGQVADVSATVWLAVLLVRPSFS
jgi:hypothetical protein